ncbi:hypothetical protein M7I_0441 [Glarea lozoyensis 74030]|uniref:Uncharacterized protein n=1 Tax=Glarea lozoyensis (strain ATCC 74030 / MF5533) TaxID=1104152 RepID=H0EDD3_GLAL7|nr:hypothetical protein M7I_0441 [Glarea lozoyensis 74030]
MADGEAFEDDLFADLYTEDDVAPKVEPTHVKEDPPAVVEPKLEDAVEQHDPNGNMEVQTYDAEPDEDDDIDFNLGNGNGYDSPANHDAHGPGIKEDGFVKFRLGDVHPGDIIQVKIGWVQ